MVSELLRETPMAAKKFAKGNLAANLEHGQMQCNVMPCYFVVCNACRMLQAAQPDGQQPEGDAPL